MSAQLDPNPIFEPMRFADVDQVLEIENDVYPYPWTRNNFNDSLAAGYSAWLCRVRGELVGYGVMMLVLDEAHLLNLSVKRSWQGKGYGRTMLEYLFSVARGCGANRMFLEVRPSNTQAIGLYDDVGFSAVGVRRGYYPAASGREDAIVMAVNLV